MNSIDVINGSFLGGAGVEISIKGLISDIKKNPPIFTQTFKPEAKHYAEWKLSMLTSGNASWIESHHYGIILKSKTISEEQYSDWYGTGELKIPTYIFDKFSPEIFSVLYMDKGNLYSDKETSYIDVASLEHYERTNLCEAIKFVFGYVPRNLGQRIGMGRHLTNRFCEECAPWWPLAMARKSSRKELIPQWKELTSYPGF